MPLVFPSSRLCLILLTLTRFAEGALRTCPDGLLLTTDGRFEEDEDDGVDERDEDD